MTDKKEFVKTKSGEHIRVSTIVSLTPGDKTFTVRTIDGGIYYISNSVAAGITAKTKPTVVEK